jgi:hypothetical protein
MLKEDKNIYEKESTSLISHHISKKHIINIVWNDSKTLAKSCFYIRTLNSSDNIKLKPSSIKRIFFNGKLSKNKYIKFYYNKGLLSLGRGDKIKTEKEINEETTEYEDECSITLKDDEDSPSSKQLTINKEKVKNEENDKQAIILDTKNKNENIFNPKLPLLQNKIQNTFSNIDNLPPKYINLIIFCNKITISLDYLKCLYLTIFFCGLFNFIFFLDILFDKNSAMDNFYHIFFFPLALILMVTGGFGYKKAKENIYDNIISIILTYFSFFLPIGSFALSKINLEENMKKNFAMNIGINFISSFFSFLCIIILKEYDRVKNSDKNILQV